MANNIKEYKKLPGSKKGFFIGKYTLWQGADHLLHIFSRFGAEDYKRFYFSDIQSIITRKTIVGKVQNIILGCLTLLFLLPAFIFDGGWSIFYIIFSTMMFILLLINLSLGSTCETRVMTAVQTETLQSLHRLKTTFRVMDRLGPYIQQAQGTLSREDMFKIAAPPDGHISLQGSGQSDTSTGKAVKHENGRAHMILFALLLVDGILVASEFFISHPAATILSSVVRLCIGIFVIIALVRQFNSDLPGHLRTITWTSFGFVGVTFIMGYIFSMMFAFKNPGITLNQWEVIKSISNLSPWDSPLKLSYNFLVLCGAFFLGIPGLIMYQRSLSRGNMLATARSGASGQRVATRTPEMG
jgi:hypothetical protein